MSDPVRQVGLMMAGELRGDLQGAVEKAAVALARPETLVEPDAEV